MALWRELDPAERGTVRGELTLRDGILRRLILDASRRATTLVTALLIVSLALLSLVFGRIPLTLAISALTALMLGVLALGAFYALQHQVISNLYFSFGWWRSRIFSNETDAGTLDGPPVRLRAEKISTALVYVASLFWIIGAVIGMAATRYEAARPTGSPPLVAAATPHQADARATANENVDLSPGAARALSVSDKIAAAALIAALVQAGALIGTIAISIRTARRQLRAYIGVNTFDLVEGTILKPPLSEHINEPGVVIPIKNSGQTPAYKVAIVRKLEIVDLGLEDSLVIPPVEQTFYSYLPPGASSQTAFWLGRSVSQAEFAAINVGTKVIVVYGRVEYTDAFKKRRYTTFRAAYTGRFPPTVAAALTYTKSGNDAN